jgi:general nucleoside transport system permease protein
MSGRSVKVGGTAPTGAPPRQPVARAAALTRWTVRSLGPILAALIVGAVLLAILGRNPLAFYGDLFRTGLFSSVGWQAMVVRLAPLLLMGMGYIVAFRAGLWNIGGDGQFLLAAAIVAGLGPAVMGAMNRPSGLILLALVGMAVGGAWTLLPAYLKAWHGVNEIITSVMMSFVGTYLGALLIQEVWRSSPNLPQTGSVPLSQLLPRLGGSTIHAGIIVALAAAAIVWYVLDHTSTGLRLTVLGANPRAAKHAGLPVKRLIVVTFFASGALIGLAGAVEILGEWGYMRATWNPGFGLPLFALVFLARLSPVAAIPLAAFYAVLDIGGHEATRLAGLDNDFVLILIGLVLLFMAVTQYAGRLSRLRRPWRPGRRRAARAQVVASLDEPGAGPVGGVGGAEGATVPGGES